MHGVATHVASKLSSVVTWPLEVFAKGSRLVQGKVKREMDHVAHHSQSW